MVAITGVVRAIKVDDRDSGRVEMQLDDEPHDRRIDPIGVVNRETEIMIDGRLARIGEVRKGDRALVVGRLERDADRWRFVAVRAEVSRAMPD